MKKNELILSVRDLNIKFNLRGKILHAIRGIDLDVYHGEVLAIVGESGSGKSVFTKSFMGLLDSNGSITSGTIDYFGADDHQPIRLSELKKEKDWLKVRGHEIAMIMQDPIRQPHYAGGWCADGDHLQDARSQPGVSGEDGLWHRCRCAGTRRHHPG